MSSYPYDPATYKRRKVLADTMMHLTQALLEHPEDILRLDRQRQEAWIEWLWTYSIFDEQGPRYMADRFEWLPKTTSEWHKSYGPCPFCHGKPQSIRAGIDVLPLMFAPVFRRSISIVMVDNLPINTHFCTSCGQQWQTSWDDQVIGEEAMDALDFSKL